MSHIITEDIGCSLRQLRKAQNLTLEQAAQAAGLSRSAVNRWEIGINLPRLVELNALLQVLEATAQQKRAIISRMDAPRARKQVQGEVTRITEEAGIGSRPHEGDLLRAMRLRQGLSSDNAANRIGVTARTLLRWEQGEISPPPEQLHALCHALAAHEAEIAALAAGTFSATGFLQQPPSSDTIRAQAATLNNRIHNGDQTLIELCCLILEAQAWQLAVAGIEPHLYFKAVILHAQYLNLQGRKIEAKRLAERVLEQSADKMKDNTVLLRARILIAQGMAHQSSKAGARRAAAFLSPWLSLVHLPEGEAWLQAEIAGHFAQAGLLEEALTLSENAFRLAEQQTPPTERARRGVDRARVLMKAECFSEAVSILETIEADTPYFHIDIALARSEAYQSIGHSAEACFCLQQALSGIDTLGLDTVRIKADKIAQRIAV